VVTTYNVLLVVGQVRLPALFVRVGSVGNVSHHLVEERYAQFAWGLAFCGETTSHREYLFLFTLLLCSSCGYCCTTRQFIPNIPPVMEEIILLCLEKETKMRFKDGSQ